MSILLDTHIFLWYITGARELSAALRGAIQAPGNAVYLSVVSLWEIIIKHELGKLALPEAPETYMPRQRTLHRISTLPVDEASVSRLAALPSLHRDPFDRMLICQAQEHGLTLATVDQALQAYAVAIWRSA